MPARADTPTAVANGALALLGEPPIASIESPDGAAARAVNLHFWTARDAALRSYDWNFAKTWVAPSKDPVAELGPLTGRFPLPADCLRVRSVWADDAPLDAASWEVISGMATVATASVETSILLTNATSPQVCYTRRVETVPLWDALFVEAFELHLAQRIVVAIGRDPSELTTAWRLHQDKLETAQRVDAQESAPQRIQSDVPALRARRGWRYRGWLR